MKTIEITPHIRFRLPEEWTAVASASGIVLRTPGGGTLTASAEEFQRPTYPGMGPGVTSEQMLSGQVSGFGQIQRTLAPGRAYASHSVLIGEHGVEVECRVWHLVNRVGAWHHETVLISYEPGPSGKLDPDVISILDAELPRCEFSRSYREAPSRATDGSTEA